MAKKPENILKEIRAYLTDKGYTNDIPLEHWYSAFMMTTGYGKSKIHEWTENFELMKLIKVENQKVNFL